MTKTFISVSVSIALGMTAVHAQDFQPPYRAATPADTHRLDQLYYAQPHNSYKHSTKLTNWLNNGYHTVELDVIDHGDWEDEIKGPYVSHGLPPSNVNCSNNRLGHCLDDIIGWHNANPDHLPLLIFVDMKTTISFVADWYADEVAELDQWIGNYLGSTLYTYMNLLNHLDGFSGSTYREKLKKGGFPTIGSLRNRIIVVLTGGRIRDVNDRMEQASSQLRANQSQNTIFCPDVDHDGPEEINGPIDSISATNSGYFFCANVQAGDHYQLVANRSNEYKQLMHLWGSAGDFSNTDYAAGFIAVAHGVSAIGWDVPQNLSNPGVFLPSWRDSIPLVGVRRSLPGYFMPGTKITNGSKCMDVENSDYSNGGDLNQYTCHGGDNQRFVYTAEGQLRPKGNNKYCADYSSGSADNGDDMHLWDCDGGNSEKWAVTKDGLFKNRDKNWTYCIDVPDSSTSNGKRLNIWSCHGGNNQKFILKSVADWNQTTF
jgi:hypothetical protein